MRYPNEQDTVTALYLRFRTYPIVFSIIDANRIAKTLQDHKEIKCGVTPLKLGQVPSTWECRGRVA